MDGAASEAFCSVPAQGQIKLLRGGGEIMGFSPVSQALLASSVANVPSSSQEPGKRTAVSSLFRGKACHAVCHENQTKQKKV